MAYELYYWPTIQGRGEFVRLALEAAGAKYGPDKKQQAIEVLPLAELRPYMGDLKVESARFHVTDPRDWKQSAKLWGGCVWLVPITATAPSGNKTQYIFVVEPFGGRVISIWTILHPTSTDFPSFPPAERPPGCRRWPGGNARTGCAR